MDEIDKNEKLNRIERLKKGLYSKTINLSNKRSRLRFEKHSASQQWEKGTLKDDLEMSKKTKKRKNKKKQKQTKNK